MASNPEATFARYIHSRVDKKIHSEGMSNPYRGGTPDRYFEARQVLWVEWKFLRELPKRQFKLYEKVSPLQHKWLDRCYMNGHQCCVIVGFGSSDVLIATDMQWHDTFTREQLDEKLITRKEAIQWIESMVL